MYAKSCGLVYEMISKRICFKRKRLGKKNVDILPGEANLMSAFANNRRDEKKNKYLIPANTTRSGEPKNYISTLVSNLEFDSANDLLWGNPKEIKAYAGKLFACIVNDAFDDEDKKTVAEIERVLQDYIPYAIDKYYLGIDFQIWDTSREKIIYPADDSMKKSKQEAVCRLYQQISGPFYDILKDFLYKRENTLKLDKAFSIFLKEEMLPLIKGSVLDVSVGNEVNKILFQENDYIVLLAEQAIAEFEGLESGEERGHMRPNRELMEDIFATKRKYVEALCSVQKKHENPINLQLMESAWKEGMCMPEQIPIIRPSRDGE